MLKRSLSVNLKLTWVFTTFLVLPLLAAAAPPKYFAQRLSDINAEMTRAHDAAKLVVSQADATKKTGVTFYNQNAGLLDMMGVSVAEYPARSKAVGKVMTHIIRNLKAGVLFLQEVWNPTDFSSIETALKKLAETSPLRYQAFRTGASDQIKNGLVMVLNTALFESPETLHFEFAEYDAISSAELWGGKKRGLFYTIAKLKNGPRILLGTSHFTALTGFDDVREEQSKAMAEEVRTGCKKRFKDDYEVFVLGNDLNFSAEFQSAPAMEQKHWQNNANYYAYLFNKLNFMDAFRIVNPIEKLIGYTWDRRRNILITSPESMASRVTSKEPEQRTDVLLVGTRDTWPAAGQPFKLGIHIKNSFVTMDQPITDDQGAPIFSKTLMEFPKDAEGFYLFTRPRTKNPAPVLFSDHLAVVADVEFSI